MGYIWEQLRLAVPLIWARNGPVLDAAWVTIKVAVVATTGALVLGMVPAVALGLGRFRGRRTLQILANASLALPPVLVGIVVLIELLPGGGLLGGLRLEYTLQGVYVAQIILALPYIVALGSQAIRSLPPGLLDQARLLGAGRVRLAGLALREARIGLLAAIVASLASTVSEVAAVIIVGDGLIGHDATLTSAIVTEITDIYDVPEALALGIVLMAIILVLMGVLTILQRRGGVRLRWRAA